MTAKEYLRFEPEPGYTPPEGLTFRYSIPEDVLPMKEWFSDPEVYSWFPMDGELEIDDGAKRWLSFGQIKSSLTAELNGVPCGIATLYLQAYKRILHQSELGIIVGTGFRDKGIGTFLMKALIQLAKKQFHIELLHLQVYSGNPALNFYKRLGFKEFGKQTHWIKEKNKYVGRIFMELPI
jgi:RimJ/RimL family protein N-acetyltransferase